MAGALVSQGGSAVLCETDELIGAEGYILERVRDRATAEKCVCMCKHVCVYLYLGGG